MNVQPPAAETRTPDLGAFLDAALAVVRLPLEAELRERVLVHLGIAAGMADLVLDFPLRGRGRAGPGVPAVSAVVSDETVAELLAKDSALAIAAAVREGKVSARAVTEATLARIAALNPVLNAFTAVTTERAPRARPTRWTARGPRAGRSARWPACRSR